MIWLILFTVVFQILFTNGGHILPWWGPLCPSRLVVEIYLLNARQCLIIMMSPSPNLNDSCPGLTDRIEHLLQPLTALAFCPRVGPHAGYRLALCANPHG